MTLLAFAADRRAAAPVLLRRQHTVANRRTLLQRANGTDRRRTRQSDGHRTVIQTLLRILCGKCQKADVRVSWLSTTAASMVLNASLNCSIC